MGIKFVPFNRRENRRSLAIFFAEEIAHLGALNIARFCGGAVKIAAATAENRAVLVHSAWQRGELTEKQASPLVGRTILGSSRRRCYQQNLPVQGNFRAEKTMTAIDVTGFDAIFSTEFFATFSRF